MALSSICVLALRLATQSSTLSVVLNQDLKACSVVSIFCNSVFLMTVLKKVVRAVSVCEEISLGVNLHIQGCKYSKYM